MITYDHKQLTELKPGFLKWLKESWCDCAENFRDDPDFEKLAHGECQCYGPDEYDDVWQAVIDDDSVRIYYAQNADPNADHQRQLILPFDDDEHPPHECNDGMPLFNRRLDGEPYIKCGDLEWVGDDCDYLGPILKYIVHLIGGE